MHILLQYAPSSCKISKHNPLKLEQKRMDETRKACSLLPIAHPLVVLTSATASSEGVGIWHLFRVVSITCLPRGANNSTSSRHRTGTTFRRPSSVNLTWR